MYSSRILHAAVHLIVIVVGLVSAQFPLECEQNITDGFNSQNVVCCPIPDGYSEPCGSPARGTCERIPDTSPDYQPLPKSYLLDDRLNWPHAYVNYACNCHGNFYGPDCSECRYGYTGSDCLERERKFIRRNATSYSADDKRLFVDTLLRARTTPSGLGVIKPATRPSQPPQLLNMSVWDAFVLAHHDSTKYLAHMNRNACERPFTMAHGSSGFPTWHRLLLLWIERKLRRLSDAPRFTLPYWDWVSATDCDICTNDFFGAPAFEGNNSRIHPDSRLSDWYTICERSSETHCPPCDPRVTEQHLRRDFGRRNDVTSGLPTAEQFEYVLTLTQYDVFPYDETTDNTSFRASIEGNNGVFGKEGTMINQMHRWLGGNMYNLETSANDPIFLVVYAMVDMILEMWIERHNPDPSMYPEKDTQPGHLSRDPMVPFFPREYQIDYFTPSHTFGYGYDTMVQDIDAPSGWTGWKITAVVMIAVAGILLILLIVVLLCNRRASSSALPVTDMRGAQSSVEMHTNKSVYTVT